MIRASAWIVAMCLSISTMAGSDHVAGFSFDEGSGTVAWDDSGLSWGDISGAAWIEGISGGALAFDGMDDLVALTDGDGVPDHLAGLTEGTFAMWLRFDSDAQAGTIHSMFYLGRDWSSGEHSSFQIEVGHNQVNNKLYWTITEPGTQQPTLCYDSSWQLQTDTWYHYVLVVSPSGNTGYMNGQEMTDRHYNFGSPDDRKFLADIPLQEGCWFGKGLFAGTDQFLHGALDEVRIWDRPLSGAEVLAYFNTFDYDPPEPPKEPSVEIISPEQGDVLSGELVIAGTSTDLGGGNLRLRIGANPPVTVEGFEEWSYTWDTTTALDGPINLRIMGRACQTCPMYSHEITVEVDNIPPAIAIESIDDGDFAWGDVEVVGSTTQGGTVYVQIDGGTPLEASGTDPWLLDIDASALGTGPHTLRAMLFDGGDEVDAVEIIFVAAPEAPPAVDCPAVQWGDRIPTPNGASPDWVNTCGDVCWLTVTFHVLGHSESIGLAAHLQEVFEAEPIDGRQYVFVEHAIGGQETWEWVTPGSAGYQEVQTILDVADGADAAPHIALVLTSNLNTYPSGGGDASDPNYARFLAEAEELLELLDDGGQGLFMTYFTAHRMNPQQPMSAWYENLAIGEVMARAEDRAFSNVKPGPDLHSPTWCDFPGGYAADLAHPDADGLRNMAEAWHEILVADIRHPGDVNGDGAVSTTDLLMMLAAWGPCEDCPEDITNDGQVDVHDILMLIEYWTIAY